MEPCVECQTAEAESGIFCRRCGVIQTLYVRVTCRVLPEDYQDFSETLRGGSIRELLDRGGAWILKDTLHLLNALAAPAKLDAESLRVSLAARIAKQATREQRLATATFVVDNSGDLAALEAQMDALWAYVTSLPQLPADYELPGRVDGVDRAKPEAPRGDGDGAATTS